ncbi:MAG: oligopeptide transporter, OPT family [Candidatus Wallbacteria bacterium]|nr:oligopeptide transporter, OPT family [Candidatus Wallbacteria bacterium]
MEKKRELTSQAYTEIPAGHEYEPVIKDHENVPEFTYQAVILGIILSVVFGTANAYLGLKVGMTVSASIPAAVISMAVLRKLFKRATILENNMAQTVGSAGESLAAGVIFTIPALILLNLSPGIGLIFSLSLLGGILGVLFMIPLRNFLIVREHGRLPFPEGTACAEVIVAGESGGNRANLVFQGVMIGGIYKFIMSGLKLWSEEPEWHIPGLRNFVVGFDSMPALLGVGYIIGPKIACYMLAGGVLGWWVFIPLISFLGATITQPVYPGKELISGMDAWAVWTNYIRYVGAGAVALGGFVSLFKSIPTIVTSFAAGFRELSGGINFKIQKGVRRTQQDLPMAVVLGGALIIFACLWLMPQIPGGVIVPLLMVLFTFFFVTVSSRIVGIVGSSSNPVSGMTIATLLLTSYFLYRAGYTGSDGIIAALSIGAVVCIGIAIAGDTSQDLKTGYLVGATPYKQQIGECLGVLFSAMVIGVTVYILNESYGIGSKDLPAPQANLMKMVVEGVMRNTLPWTLVLVGAGSALVAELFGVPSLAFAVGLYLPLHLSTPIILGGIIRGWLDAKCTDKAENNERNEKGILYSSGLIAGEALMGVVLAIYVFMMDRKWITLDIDYSSQLAAMNPNWASISTWLSIFMLMLVAISLERVIMGGKREGKKE